MELKDDYQNIFLIIMVTCGVSASSYFNNNPGTVFVHENEDSDIAVWNNIDANCHVRSTCSAWRCDYNYDYDGYWNCRMVEHHYTCYYDVQCDTCDVTSNEMFYMSGKTVRKKECTSPGCGPTCSADYCLNSGQSETVEVACWKNGYETNGYVSTSFVVQASDNSPPTIWLKDGTSVTVSKDTHKVGDYVNQILYSDFDLPVGGDYIRYSITDDSVFRPWDYANISRTNDRLFNLNTADGTIYVAQDLSKEYSQTFTGIQLCIADRRDSGICITLTITLWACYEIPTCYDQEKLNFEDTHEPGATMFDMRFPDPAYHFPSFSSDWARLTWTIDRNNYLDVAEIVSIDYKNGVLRTTGNITVWPSWRYRDYEIVIRVSNSESCDRTTTCVLTFRIWFKNWPIRFVNLPDEDTKNEDDNDPFVIPIITYDYNNHLHDNVTCEMSFIPNEDKLFKLEHDGRYDFDSWSIHRLECEEPTCGFHCNKGIGCFTYNTTLNQQFVFTVHCWDAYDSDITSTFTLHLDYNRAPTFTNLPNTITLNSDTVSQHDILYSIQYNDNENEPLHYNYTISPNNGIWKEELIFQCDAYGNYYDNLANITSTIYYHKMPTTTYYIYICGTERRNMICETLAINIQDNCPSNPTCNGYGVTIPDFAAAGTPLFTIIGELGAGSTGSLSYSFTSSASSYFNIDSATGEVTIAKALKASYPSKKYHLTGYVYDSSACNYGSCQFSVTVTFTNYPITILNQPYYYTNLPEDTVENVQLVIIETADDNKDDTVRCSKVSVTSPQTTNPISQDLFRVSETFTGSMIYVINNRELPGFTSAITEYEINFMCFDRYGSSAGGSLTVTIKPNKSPVFTNLVDPTAITVDPFNSKSGTIIYSVSTVDEEKDDLIFTSHVENSFVPLELSEEGVVFLRRDVSIEKEDGSVYSINICIEDHGHPLQGKVCADLVATFESSQKYPSISNLPGTVNFPENTTSGTVLYDVDVTDGDNDSGSIHIFTMSVEPEEASTMFYIDANTGVLKLQFGKKFDYEERNLYLVTFSVRDQYLTALKRKILTINITNVNEGPVITTVREIIKFNEDKVPGDLLYSKVATCFDVDIGDHLAYVLEYSTHSHFFHINSSNADLTLAQEWDLEDSSLPTTTTIYIVCRDADGLYSKDYISVEILPVNEHDPVLDKTHISIQIDSETSVIDDLAKLTATDQDFGDDDSFEFAIAGLGLGARYFVMTNEGKLRIKNVMEFDQNKEFKFTIQVSDNDMTPKARTAYCTVTANYTAPKEQPETPPSYCLTCTTEGKLLVAGIACEAVIFVVIVVHLIHHILHSGGQTVTSAANAISQVTSFNDIRPNVNYNNTASHQQIHQNNDADNRRQNYDDDHDSISDDSDIDDSLWRAPSFYPSEQPFPFGVDAGRVFP